jgi:hypothetical protein
MIIMETFLEFIREVLKGIVRELTAYFFRKHILENKKTTLRRRREATYAAEKDDRADSDRPSEGMLVA